jgi:hypothetical protein
MHKFHNNFGEVDQNLKELQTGTQPNFFLKERKKVKQ